jgi:hypothetical protein
VKGVGRVAAMAARVGQRADDAQELHQGGKPGKRPASQEATP